ncbi:MAG TPA: ABC transporter ATP-binding protein [Acidimicrobiales bacterium]|jgi:ABC-2 type transport system ATP-binding protein
MPAVQVTDLCVRYGRSGDVVAVDGISFAAEAGEVLVVLGPNGAGKTSTIECLEGYRHPTSGARRVLGLDPASDHRALSRRVGVMLQRGGVYPMLGPRQVLELFATYYPNPLEIEPLLDLVSLRNVATTPWRHLSGGEQQRLSLAMALIGRPEVAFLDEPTAGVDPEGRRAIRDVIADLRARGVCVVITTHELAEAERMADRLLILVNGRIAAQGSLADLTAAEAPGMRFGAPAGLDASALAAALGQGASVNETEPGRYRIVGAAGPAATAALAHWLAQHDAALTDLVSGGTLEDLYFETVGEAPVMTDESVPAPSRRRARR